jgi:hypothetical protein
MLKATRLISKILPGFFLIVLTGVVGAVLLDVPKFYGLSNRARVINGAVTAKEPENHMSVWFEYNVDGQMFRSAGRAGDIGKSFETIQIGEIVPVYYDPLNPAACTMGKPDRYLESSLFGTGFILVGVTILFLIFMIKRRMNNDDLQA